MIFKNSKGFETDFLGCTICPIVESIDDGKSQLCGTGFYIHPSGLALSASHNFRKRTAPIFARGKKVDQIDAATFIRMIQLDKDHLHFLFTPITEIIYDEGIDIAIVISGVSGEPPKHLSLTDSIPKIGERICTYSYPNKPGFTNNIGTTMNVDKAWYEGSVTAHFPLGRDKLLLPGPCIEAKMAAPGGTSGGPVFNERGHIFGVISTSFDGDPPITYITPIRSIVDMSFEINTDQGRKNVSLRELGKLKVIALYNK